MGWQRSSFYFPETSLNVGIFTRHFPFLLHLLGWTKANNITDNLKIYVWHVFFFPSLKLPCHHCHFTWNNVKFTVQIEWSQRECVWRIQCRHAVKLSNSYCEIFWCSCPCFFTLWQNIESRGEISTLFSYLQFVTSHKI